MGSPDIPLPKPVGVFGVDLVWTLQELLPINQLFDDIPNKRKKYCAAHEAPEGTVSPSF
jgi:hypothetical protein